MLSDEVISAKDYISSSINMDDYTVSVNIIDAGVLYLHKPSMYMLEDVSLLHKLIGVDHNEEANDIFDGSVLNIVLCGIFYNFPIDYIEQTINEYMFKSYSTYYDNYKTSNVIRHYVEDIRRIIHRLIDQQTLARSGYVFCFDVEDDVLDTVYYMDDIHYYIKHNKANIKFRLYMLTRKKE